MEMYELNVEIPDCDLDLAQDRVLEEIDEFYPGYIESSGCVGEID